MTQTSIKVLGGFLLLGTLLGCQGSSSSRLKGDQNAPLTSFAVTGFSPVGPFSYNTTGLTVTVTTSTPAACRYATQPDTNFESMTFNLTATSEGLEHSVVFNGLTPAVKRTIYVRCLSQKNEVINKDFVVNFVLEPAPLVNLGEVKLSWDASSSTETATLAGYKIYYGPSPGQYTDSYDVGLTTRATVRNLVKGQLYYFAATAYGTLSQESGYSNEVNSSVTLRNSPPFEKLMGETSAIAR